MIGPLAVAAAMAFNMQCAGRAQVIQITGPFQSKTTSDQPFAETFRVDLETGRWCSGPCVKTFPLKGVTEHFITLDAHDSSEGETIIDDEMIVHRETGDYIARTRFGSLFSMAVNYTKAVCERAPFTGFPARKF